MDLEPNELHVEELDLVTSCTQNMEPTVWEDCPEVRAPKKIKTSETIYIETEQTTTAVTKNASLLLNLKSAFRVQATHPVPKIAIVPLKHNAYISLQENVAPSTLKKGSPPSFPRGCSTQDPIHIPTVSTLPTSPSNRVILKARRPLLPSKDYVPLSL
ncbi:hypothetical protein TNCV_2675371 [Trichonephila clavipes]|nr:hypothetical protein TNCV_2675371 [Trichonephila clavipes]